ncbi:MAG: hypothetical protein IPN75_10345 [Dechloromonas sp.]|uniref:Uncharacterized protein n=1 Tax=Candidatus Dechloromonas phosphorivorans TaxID=2899244 RepID=A0A9D7LPF3_9RHOO|nr:hypothetical protein [Candidatus Dechloromonas phosphorivorans]
MSDPARWPGQRESKHIVIGIVLWQGHLLKNLGGALFATRKVRLKLLLEE